jgi:hypothetical protein
MSVAAGKKNQPVPQKGDTPSMRQELTNVSDVCNNDFVGRRSDYGKAKRFISKRLGSCLS